MKYKDIITLQETQLKVFKIILNQEDDKSLYIQT